MTTQPTSRARCSDPDDPLTAHSHEELLMTTHDPDTAGGDTPTMYRLTHPATGDVLLYVAFPVMRKHGRCHYVFHARTGTYRRTERQYKSILGCSARTDLTPAERRVLRCTETGHLTYPEAVRAIEEARGLCGQESAAQGHDSARIQAEMLRTLRHVHKKVSGRAGFQDLANTVARTITRAERAQVSKPSAGGRVAQ